MKRYMQVKVLVEHSYLVPMYDDTTTKIDGRKLDDVMEEWFKDYNINHHHTTRDAHEIGNGRKVIKFVAAGLLEAKC